MFCQNQSVMSRSEPGNPKCITGSSHHKNPVTPSELSLFAELCLTISPDLGVGWVENLFTRNGSSSKDMSDTLSALCQKLTINPVKSLVAESYELLEGYRIAVIEWARLFKLSSGINYKISEGFVHSKIRHDQHNLRTAIEQIQAEEVLQRPQIKAGIIGASGCGKSILCQYLAGLAAHLTDESLPIPIDGRSFQMTTNIHDMIYSAIQTVWPTCPLENFDLLIKTLIESLQNGRGIALIDNWEWTTNHLSIISRACYEL